MNPPRGVLNAVRGYLSLVYRDATSEVDTRNHCTQVMDFEMQQDSFSCSFYVLGVMAKVGNGCKHDSIPGDLYKSYDVSRTRSLRRIVSKHSLLLVIECMKGASKHRR